MLQLSALQREREHEFIRRLSPTRAKVRNVNGDHVDTTSKR